MINPYTSVLLVPPAMIELKWTRENCNLELKIEGRREKGDLLTVTLHGTEKNSKRHFKKEVNLRMGQMLHIGYYSSSQWMPAPYVYIDLSPELNAFKESFEPKDEPLLTLYHELSGMRALSEYAHFTAHEKINA